jgi:hypothetical protein
MLLLVSFTLSRPPLTVKWAQTMDTLHITVPRKAGCSEAKGAMHSVESVPHLRVSAVCTGEESVLFDLALEAPVQLDVAAKKGRSETHFAVMKQTAQKWERLTPLAPASIKVVRDFSRGDEEEEEDGPDEGRLMRPNRNKKSTLPANDETLKVPAFVYFVS